jgi:hypothetical protein
MNLQVGELLCSAVAQTVWIYFFVFIATMFCIIFIM